VETSPRKWADYRANLFRTCESNMGELATCPTRQHATYRNPSIGPAMTATIAIKLTERNARVSFKLTARTMVNRRKACRSESKKQYGNQPFHLIHLIRPVKHGLGNRQADLLRRFQIERSSLRDFALPPIPY